jgi:hypothetical protein
LVEVRDLAKREAERRGHKIKRWNRHRAYRYTAICENCGADLAAFSRVIDTIGWPDFKVDHGTMYARDRDRYWTGLDYNWAQGEALIKICPGKL